MGQLPTEIHVLQSSYTNEICPITIQKGRNKLDKLTDDESHQFRVLAGQHNKVANQKRPDVAFSALQASTATNSGTVSDPQAANKAVKRWSQRK